jgi:hypothetical protein
VWLHQIKDEQTIVSGLAVSQEEAFAILSDGTLRAYDLLTVSERIILESDALAYRAPVGSTPLPVPSIAVYSNKLFITFGCHKVYVLDR